MTDLENIYNLLIEYSKAHFNLKFVKNLKSGKEASVVLVENLSFDKANDNNLSKYFALKVYRDLNVRSFVKRSDYLEGIFIKRKSIRHAVQKNTNLGRQYLESRWISQEVNLLKKLSKKTAVPKFYANVRNSILMEFAGSFDTLVPFDRLSDIKLDIIDVDTVFNQIIDFQIEITKLGFVHSDLSPFNILVNPSYIDKNGKIGPKAIVIDFPQAVNIITNKNAKSKFDHDLNQIILHFKSEYNYENKKLALKASNIFNSKLERG